MDHRYQKFLAVAETGSFSLAAKKLHVSQPAVTLAVLSLEHAYDTKFCLRLKRSVELTEDGIALAEACANIDLEIDKLKLKLNKPIEISQLSLGFIDSIAQLIYASPILSELISNASVMVDNSRNIIADVQVGKIDAGIITGQTTTKLKDINIKKMHNEEFVFVCSPAHKEISSDNEIDDWLAFNQYSTTYQHFTKIFKKNRLNVKPIFYSTSMEILKNMAINGKGTALLPRHVVQKSIDSGALKIVQTGKFNRPLWLITREGVEADKLILKLVSNIDAMLV